MLGPIEIVLNCEFQEIHESGSISKWTIFVILTQLFLVLYLKSKIFKMVIEASAKLYCN